MNRKNNILPFLITIATLFGCDDKYNTSHPDEGGVVLTMDWSNIESTVPSTYQAYIASVSGQNRLFDNLSGASNSLVVEPGEATLYVYNNAEQIYVTGNKAIIKNDGTGIASNPDFFYTFSKKIVTERDKDISQTALMNRQTGELKISLAIKPAAMIPNIRAVSAVLEGVASGLDMQTNELSTPSSTTVNFSKNSYYAVATIRVFGFIRQNAQNLRLNIEFENGNKASATSDLTSYLSNFNESKNKLFALNASMYAPDVNTTTLTIDYWEHSTENRYLSVYPATIDLPGVASIGQTTIVTDRSAWDYSISQTGNWLTVSKSDNQLMVSAIENTDTEARQAIIIVSAEGLNESITVTQKSRTNPADNDFYTDKETVKLQSATIGKGINIVLLGDGYTSNEMKKSDGKYEQDMRAAANHFFSTYPISDYRDYFNVYMITAISNQAGLSNELTGTTVDTQFQTRWKGGNSTEIHCNANNVYEYVTAIADLSSTYIHDITVIMPINEYIRAGTCYLYGDDRPDVDYGNGFSISMCPVGAEFNKITVHEAAGHGFAKADDEYIYYPKDIIPQEEIDNIKVFKAYGWYENVDFYDNIFETSWKGFANLSKYNMVGAFEGASYYGKGVWRPEYNSCMNNNTLYFNAPTRWAQVRRIHKLAGINYTFSQFLQDDKVPAVPASTLRKGEEFIPLARPVIKTLF